jgi:hypothetical protein
MYHFKKKTYIIIPTDVLCTPSVLIPQKLLQWPMHYLQTPRQETGTPNPSSLTTRRFPR